MPPTPGPRSNEFGAAINAAAEFGAATNASAKVAVCSSPSPDPPGALYVTYALTALLFSSGLVETLGPRRSLVFGSALYSAYVLSLPIGASL